MGHRKRVVLALLMTMGTVLLLKAQTPVAPTNLQADIEGCKVSLSWQRGGGEALITHEGFEGDIFPTFRWENISFKTLVCY